ncbi:MAG: PepSY domain-containing protein, partial [Pseudomonadota bacterium]
KCFLFLLLGYNQNMIQRILVLSVLIFLLFTRVQAQDSNSIRVVKEDGQIQSLEIPKATVPAVQKEEVQSPVIMTGEDLLKQMEKADVEKPQSAQEELKEQIVVKKEEIKVEQKKKQEKIVKTAPKKGVTNKVKKQVIKSYIPSSETTPLPSIKPQQRVVQKPSKKVDYTNLPKNFAIDKDAALRIALEYAPPARSYTVFENRQFQDRVVYQVSFRTPEGVHDVLVDAENGKVLKK